MDILLPIGAVIGLAFVSFVIFRGCEGDSRDR